MTNVKNKAVLVVICHQLFNVKSGYVFMSDFTATSRIAPRNGRLTGQNNVKVLPPKSSRWERRRPFFMYKSLLHDRSRWFHHSQVEGVDERRFKRSFVNLLCYRQVQSCCESKTSLWKQTKISTRWASSSPFRRLPSVGPTNRTAGAQPVRAGNQVGNWWMITNPPSNGQEISTDSRHCAAGWSRLSQSWMFHLRGNQNWFRYTDRSPLAFDHRIITGQG